MSMTEHRGHTAPARPLTGDRNQCRGCGEFFNSSFAFDKHRAGEFGTDRHCLSAEQMRAKGMDRNAAGFWISSAMPQIEREAA